MNKLIISFVLSGMLVACASNKPKVEEPTVAPPAAAPAPVVDAAASAPTSSETLPPPVVAPSAPPQESMSIPSKRNVYYAFDSYTIEDAYKPVIQEHAKYLNGHPKQKVRLEGNADERGSNEYNLALGQRRADSVKKMLVLSGVQESQIDTMSYGEEKPRCTEHDEACWAQNRRTDLVYQ